MTQDSGFFLGLSFCYRLRVNINFSEIPGLHQRSISSSLREVILPLHCTLMRPHLGNCVQPSAQEGHVGVGPEKGQEDDQRAGASLL